MFLHASYIMFTRVRSVIIPPIAKSVNYLTHLLFSTFVTSKEINQAFLPHKFTSECQYIYILGRSFSELDDSVPLPNSHERSTSYSDILIGCIKNIYVNSFFPSRTRLGNSFSAKCFVLNYDQSGFKPRINKLWSES